MSPYALASGSKGHSPDNAATPAVAGAAADVDVGVAKDVRHDFTDVRQTQQHQRDSEHGVGDADEPTPERLGSNVAIACDAMNAQQHGQKYRPTDVATSVLPHIDFVVNFAA